MNQENFTRFAAAYRTGLQEAVTANPENYYTRGASPEEYAAVVSARLLASIGGGNHYGVSYDSPGFRRACKALGIKHTRKAILTYLDIEP